MVESPPSADIGWSMSYRRFSPSAGYQLRKPPLSVGCSTLLSPALFTLLYPPFLVLMPGLSLPSSQLGPTALSPPLGLFFSHPPSLVLSHHLGYPGACSSLFSCSLLLTCFSRPLLLTSSRSPFLVCTPLPLRTSSMASCLAPLCRLNTRTWPVHPPLVWTLQ